MDFIFNPIEDSPSVFVKTPNSIICCVVTTRQKNESDQPLAISFKEPASLSEQEHIAFHISKALKNTCPVTQILVEFVEVVKGWDAYACYINGFSIAANLAKIDVIDSICGATYSIGDKSIENMAILINSGKIVSFGIINGSVGHMEEGVEECKKNYRYILSRLNEYKATGRNRD